MRLTSLYTGENALIAHASALTTIGDNLANMNTTGFKDSRTEFADLMSDTVGSLFGSDLASGGGVKQEANTIIHDQQGAINPTERDLDFAINGNGYFILQNGDNTFYTRAGEFTKDSKGDLVTNFGDQVMGFTEASPTTLVPLNLTSAAGTAKATTTVNITGNLDVSSPITTTPTDTTTFQGISSTASFSNPISAYDSLGNKQDITLYFYHTAASTWTVQGYVDALNTGGVAGTPVSVGSGTITFPTTGIQDPATPNLLTLTPAFSNGAAAGNYSVDITKLTGFAAGSNFSNIVIDGNSTGTVTSYQVDKDGKIQAKLSSGEEVTVGTIALADFPNTDGLERIGNNRYSAKEEAGDVIVGAPLTTNKGSIVGSALESSTVDPTEEFVEMVRFQRGYQANSQVITTMSELINSTIQIA